MCVRVCLCCVCQLARNEQRVLQAISPERYLCSARAAQQLARSRRTPRVALALTTLNTTTTVDLLEEDGEDGDGDGDGAEKDGNRQPGGGGKKRKQAPP